MHIIKNLPLVLTVVRGYRIPSISSGEGLKLFLMPERVCNAAQKVILFDGIRVKNTYLKR